MRALAVSLCVASLLVLTGCASTIAALNNNPSAPHTIRPGRFFTITGERRLAFQVERFEKGQVPPSYWDNKLKRNITGRPAWCAESLPEASQAVSAASKPTAAVTDKATLGTEDSFSTTLVQTFTRTEIAELYRQMGWQACQAWAQGVYTDEQYAEQLTKLLDGGLAVIKTRASQPLSPPADAAAIKAANEKAAADKAVADKAAKCKVTPTAAECKATATPSN